MLELARSLAAMVGPVLPVDGKIPMWPEWQKRASREVNGDPEWRTATGVGLLTGKRAGYFVLDVDGAKGAATLAQWEREKGKLPLTWTARTGSGGLHFFFGCPDFDVQCSAGKIGIGIDVRGEGGQVVAPGSRHSSGALYRWEEGAAPEAAQLAGAPAWLLEMLRPQPTPNHERRAQLPLSAGTRDRRYGESALRDAADKIEKEPEGGRNVALNREGFGIGQLVGGGVISRAAAEVALSEAAARAGLDAAEIRATVRSALDDGEKEPRGLPESARQAPANPAPGVGEHVSDWKQITMEDVERPPVEKFLCGVLFPFGKASVISGPSGAGKSAFLSQLVFQTAAGGGGSFLGMLMHDQEGAPVLVWTAEDTLDDWKRKAATVRAGFPDLDIGRALGRLFILEKTEGAGRLSEIVQIRTDLGGGASNTAEEHRPTTERLRIIAKAQEVGARLIVLETASRLVPKEDNPDFTALLSAAGHIAAETGAAVIISHHPTKNASKENDSSAEGTRGGGAFVNNSRTAVSLFPADEATLAYLRERDLHFADEVVLRLEHQKGTSSVPLQKPIALVRCGTPHGAFLQLPEMVASDPAQMAAHAARARREEQAQAGKFCALYDKVQELRAAGPVSKRGLRDYGPAFGVPKRDVDGFVAEALRVGVLSVERADTTGRVLALGLGRRPLSRLPAFDARATACDPELSAGSGDANP